MYHEPKSPHTDHGQLSHWRTLIRLLALARPHWQWLCIGILLSVITLLANIALLSVAGWFIAAMAAAGIAGVSINYFTPSGVIRFLAIVRTAGRYAERLVTHNATFLMLAELRHWFYQKLEPLAPAGLHQYRSSDLLSRLQADIEQLDNFYLRIALPVIVALISLPMIYALSAYYYQPVALVLIIALLTTGVALPFWVAKKTQRSGRLISLEQQQLSTAIIDGLQGMRELEIYGASERQKAHVLACSEKLSTTQAQLNHVNASAQSISLAITSLCVWCCLLLLSSAVVAGHIKGGDLVMLLLLVIGAFEAVLPLPLAFEQLAATLAAAKRLFQLADQRAVRPEPEHPAIIEQLAAEQQLTLSIEQLSFSYPAATEPAISHFSAQIKQGQKVALTGASGSGKSTLVQLLQGFYPCKPGMISLQSANQKIDINQCSGDDLRAQIALVSQSCYLFSASIRDNLLLANPQASDQQLRHACEVAGANAFIDQLPQGIDTWLGETGKGLSGGQARRIHIAQALLKDAPILILDEPTEGLDPITEQQVMEAIWQLMDNKTVILITHNPRLLEGVDKIYSLS